MIQCLGDDPSIPQAFKGDRSTDDRGKVCDKGLLGRMRAIIFHGEICRGIVGLSRAARSFGTFWEMLGSDHPELELLLWTGVVYSSPHVTHADII